MEILATEMQWTSARPDDDLAMKGFLSIVSAVLPSETRLTDSVKCYNKSLDLITCSEAFSALIRSPNAGCVAIPQDMSLMHFVSIVSGDTIRTCLLGSTTDLFYDALFLQNCNTSVAAIVSNYGVVDANLQRLRSWTQFMFGIQNMIAKRIFKPIWSEGDAFQRIFFTLLGALPNSRGLNSLKIPPTMSLEFVRHLDGILKQLVMFFKQKMNVDCSQLCLGLHAVAATLESLLCYSLQDHKVRSHLF